MVSDEMSGPLPLWRMKQSGHGLNPGEKEQSKMDNAAKTAPNTTYKRPQFVGMPVFVRTVTYHYTGRLAAIDADWLHLEDVAWVADSGRWHLALATGVLDEVEPFPDGPVLVARSAVVDMCRWAYGLPRAAK